MQEKLPSKKKRVSIFIRSLKFFGYSFLSIFILIAGTFLYVYYKYPPDTWRPLLESVVGEAIYSKVRIKSIEYNWNGSLKLNSVTIYALDPKSKDSRPVIAQVPQAQIYLNPLAMLYKKLHIIRISLDQAKINLVKYNGRYNVERFFKKIKKNNKNAFFKSVSINTIALNDTKLTVKGSFLSGLHNIDLIIKPRKTLRFNLAYYEAKKKTLIADFTVNAEKIEGEAKLNRINRKMLLRFLNLKKVQGIESGQIKFTKNSNDLNLKLELKKIKQSYLTPLNSAIDVSGEVDYKLNSNRLTSKALRIKANNQTVSIYNLKKNKKQIRLDAKVDLDISNFAKSISGRIKGDIKYDSTIGIRQASLNIIDFKSAYLQKKRLPLKIKNNVIQIQKLPINLYAQKLILSASLQLKNISNLQLNLVLYSQHINLDNLLKSIADKPQTKKSSNSSVSIRAKIEFKKITYGRFIGNDLTAHVNLSKNTLSVTNLLMKAYDASVKGSYEKTNRGQSVKLSILNLKPNNILRPFGFKTRAYGILNGNFGGTTSASTATNFFKKFKGSISLSGGSGHATNFSLQKFLGGVLGPLEDKLDDFEYDSFRARFTLNNGDIYVKELKLFANSVKLQFLGKLKTDFHGDIAARLKFNDRFIEGVASPLALRIQHTKLGSWYNLSFQCNGNILKKHCWRSSF